MFLFAHEVLQLTCVFRVILAVIAPSLRGVLVTHVVQKGEHLSWSSLHSC